MTASSREGLEKGLKKGLKVVRLLLEETSDEKAEELWERKKSNVEMGWKGFINVLGVAHAPTYLLVCL